MAGHGVIRSLTLACLALVLALPMMLRPEDLPGPYRPWTPLEPLAEPNLITRFKLMRSAAAPVLCRAALTRAGARAPDIPDRNDSPQCHIRDAQRLSRLGRAGLRPVATRCAVALRLLMWEIHVLQPAARRHLGAEVAEILHYSSYSCRPMRTSSGASGRMSEHATANAFDISGFRLGDGRRITLSRDWRGPGPEADFLRAARDGLCRYFRVVLSPDYNSLHADHFHVDQGVFLTCR